MSKDGFALLPCINMTDRCPVYKRLVAISQIIDGELPSASTNSDYAAALYWLESWLARCGCLKEDRNHVINEMKQRLNAGTHFA